MGLSTAIRRTLRKFGVDLHRAQPQIQDFLSYYHIDCVVDVGANVGQFATTIREYGYDGHILSIEPVSKVYQQLQEHAKQDPRWQTLQCGLAAKSGEMVVHVSEESAFSSMLEPLQRAVEFDLRARTVREETVAVNTLDTVVDQHCSSFQRMLLKLDVQGFEEEVLAGASTSLERFKGIQVELSIQKLYKGQSSMDKMIQLLDQHGFTLALCTPVNFQEDGAPRLIELDGVFINNKV